MWDQRGDGEATRPAMPDLPEESSDPARPRPASVATSPPSTPPERTAPAPRSPWPAVPSAPPPPLVRPPIVSSPPAASQSPSVPPAPGPVPTLSTDPASKLTPPPIPRARRRMWPLVLLALATVLASGAVAWFVADRTIDESTAAPIELGAADQADADATAVTGAGIDSPAADGAATAPTTPAQPAGGISGEFLASEPFAAAAAKIAPSVVQLTLDNGLGSGVIIDESGTILTAAHVVGSTTELEVRLFDGSTVPGTVLGTHGPTDVAVVQIDGDNLDLVVAPLADGDEVQVGQLALAVGSPFGFDQTVTAGIISAVDRVVNNVSMVQTDAPINPGNSGGPLIDLQGRVVGINDLIFTQSGSSAGVGFAISIDLAMVVADQLVEGQEVQLALLGVTTSQSPDGAAGALIDQIVEGSAAEAAGFEIGDRVVSVDGVATRGSRSLRAQVIDNRPGTELEFGVIRDGEQLTIRATLGSTG